MALWGRIWDIAFCFVPKFRPTMLLKTSSAPVFLWTSESRVAVTDLMRFATNLSILSRCNKSVKIRLVATCHLQTCYNLLKRLEASLWITSFDNQLATSLFTTGNRLIVNKLSQAMRTHPDIGLSTRSQLKDVNLSSVSLNWIGLKQVRRWGLLL